MRRPAFTLIELLVVIALVAILVAILVPSLGAVRRSSRVTACASNLRQIGQAMFAYRAERRAWPVAAVFPPPLGPSTAPPLPAMTDVLDGYLAPTSGVYRCPGDLAGDVFDRAEAVPGGRGNSYCFWPLAEMPRKFDLLANDIQGWASQTESLYVAEFHPPKRGMNTLLIDGSVQFDRLQK